MKTLDIIITDEAGFHARPASFIAKKAVTFESKIHLLYQNKVTNLKSVIKIVGQAIPQHANVQIVFDGEDEDLAFETIKRLFKTLNLTS